jgi:hypothetical protein
LGAVLIGMKRKPSGIEIFFVSSIVIILGLLIYGLYMEFTFLNEHHCQQTGNKEMYRIGEDGWVHYRREYKCDDGLHWSTVDK